VQQPRERQLRRRGIAVFGQRLDVLDQREIPGEVLALEARVATPPVAGREIVDRAEAAGDEAAAERAVGNQRDAELDGRVVGYSYATAYRARPAYRYTIEDSVYVGDGLNGRGIGTMLLGELIARCERGPWRQMLAVIGDSGNHGSIALHRRLGFRHVGTLTSVGFKLGRWVDSVFMQRALGAGDAARP
ncbi:MAG TPA: GNAT family N-acetyltransferase, partial [Steroidobacteraceae bacterium]|nr:GNAT family N-acetyltransferase [Steroidobacteraceae bacterium]